MHVKTYLNGFGGNVLERPVAMTIGSFDGVHTGHIVLLKRLFEAARRTASQSLVLTFDPHPAQVIKKTKSFWRLFDLEDQQRQFSKMEVDHFVVERFSQEFAQLSAMDFLNYFLFDRFDLRAVVVGYDFSFGANRSGDFELLKAQCEKRGVEVERVPAYLSEGAVVSSSRIRDLVGGGDVEKAASLLGRPFSLTGVVLQGDRRGRSIGFRTANLKIDPETTPLSGVYASLVEVEGKIYKSVSNIGTRPTFTGIGKSHQVAEVFLETHIFDFDHDIYGKRICVFFKKFIRDERKFSDKEALIEQIHLDVEAAGKVLM